MTHCFRFKLFSVCHTYKSKQGLMRKIKIEAVYQNFMEGNKLTSSRISALGSMIQNMAWNLSKSLKICAYFKNILLKNF